MTILNSTVGQMTYQRPQGVQGCSGLFLYSADDSFLFLGGGRGGWGGGVPASVHVFSGVQDVGSRGLQC